MDNGQYAFRVKPTKPQADSVPSNTYTSNITVFYSRKPHNKSRGGCLGCKKRRKKCDEKKPKCSRCVEKSADCTYPTLQQRTPRLIEANDSARPCVLWPVAMSPPVLTDSPHVHHTSHDLTLLDHFVQNVGASIAGPDYSYTFTVQVLDIAKEVPFLMHAMLALAACSLQHTVENGLTYRLPEALHTQLASHGLRQAVRHMNSAKDMDSVLTGSMLLNCLAFCYADWRDDEEEVQRTHPSWQWLRIQIGLKGLLIETKPFHVNSIWMPMFIATKNFLITEPPSNDLDVRLARFCGITPESTDVENIYFDFYTQLAPLVVREPDIYYLRMYSNAIGGIDDRFVTLLEKEDSKALLLFAHWLALMCSCVSWWITRRTTRECWMICHILDKRLEGEDRMLLERPAVACGYSLFWEEPSTLSNHIPRTTFLSNTSRGVP